MESQFGIANVWIQGDFVTRAVAVLLLGMSLASWIVILIKALDIIKFKKHARAAQDFWHSEDFAVGMTKLSLGTYFAQVSEVLSQEDMPNPELQSLLLNCLYALSKLDLPESQVKAVFELRAACLSGYTPDLTGCHVCGSQTPERFDLSAGMLECRNCRSPESNGIRMPVPPSVLEAMRYICYCDSKKLFSFQAGEDTLQQLSEVTEAYLATQLERGFSTLDFYKSLLI